MICALRRYKTVIGRSVRGLRELSVKKIFRQATFFLFDKCVLGIVLCCFLNETINAGNQDMLKKCFLFKRCYSEGWQCL